MSDGALTPAVVDVPLGSLNQLPPDHAGPTGRLVQLYDAITRRYDAANGKRTQIDPRPSFVSLSNVLRNSQTGVVDVDGAWANPSFLFALGDQLLSICAGRPRVFTGADWTHYGANRVVTQKLSQSVLHATNRTIAAADSAWLDGVTCSVWTEQEFLDGTPQVLNTSVWLGFRSDDGAWVRVPTQLISALGSANDYAMAKVVQDGERFWVFYNLGPVEFPAIAVTAYDTHGVLLAQTSVTRRWVTAPGYWDVYASLAAGVLLAQPGSYSAAPADVDVRLTRFTFGTPIIVTPTPPIGAHCMGPVAWLTNDLPGAPQYLATIGPGGEGSSGGKLWAYEIDDALSVTHEYDVVQPLPRLPDSVTGWPEESGTPGERHVYLSYSLLATGPAAVGPTWDPATRAMKTVKTTFAGVTSFIRNNYNVLQQSRAFAIDGEYYAYTYYASGSGQALPSAAEEVFHTAGDYFIGAAEQEIPVAPGDIVYGPAFAPLLSLTSQLSPAAGAQGPFNIDGGGTADRVEQILAPAGLDGVPAGTTILRWTFKLAALNPNGGAILQVNTSSIPSANAQWDIVANSGSATVVYTSTTNRLGGTVTPGNFTTTGTMQIVATVFYAIDALSDNVSDDAATLFDNGTITVAGASFGGNNGVFTILIGRTITAGSLGPDGFKFGPHGTGVWTLQTTQDTQPAFGGATASIAPPLPNGWGFTQGDFTFADIGSTLHAGGTEPGDVANPITGNNGDFEVTASPSETFVVTGGPEALNVVAQRLGIPPPFPTAKLRLAGGAAPYTLFLQDVGTSGFDDSYIGAQVSIANAIHQTTNGVYIITDIIDADTVIVRTTNDLSNQRSETFSSDPVPSIFIQRATNVNQQTQPTWFVTPLTGFQPQVGCFEKGLAYADWRFDGEAIAVPEMSAQNRYRFHLASTSLIFVESSIRQVVLPFRAGTFTQVSIATVGATPLNIANTSLASTVGLKIFRSTGRGEGTGDAGKLLVPGLLATEFTLSGFAESNFNVGPEAPFRVSQGEDTLTSFALTPGATYTYQVVFATTLENGDIVRSLPSPPIQVTLTGDNNFIVLGGRWTGGFGVWDGGGVSSAGFGLTNHSQLTIEIYRTVVAGGVPSTQLHIVTNPGNPNGLYDGSAPGSGFTFVDAFTWNYRDENPDAGVQATEVIYAGSLGQGIAPHFPAPAFRHATTWNNRRWVVGYDGAVWMSAELLEGEDPWFFPGFRYPFPEEDPAVAVVGFENYLLIFCEHSVWRVGLAELPNATLTSGAMPTPVRVPLAAGCSGFAIAMPDFVAYSSSVNGGRQVWAIARNLQAAYLSEPIEDEIANPISGLAVDGQQRLLVTTGSDTHIRVFDPVPREWYVWRMPTAPDLIANYLGQPTYQDGALVLQQTEAGFTDVYGAFQTPVALDVTLASLSFAAVRAVKRLWEAQIIGRRNGACNINAEISYPDDAPGETTTFGPTLLTNQPLLLAINPMIEQASTFGIRIFGSYEGVAVPGRCFSLEMLSCEVGLAGRMGVGRLPNGFRLVGG